MAPSSVSPLERQQQLVTEGVTQTYWHRVRFELVGRLIEARNARQVLDFGAGSGLLGEWMASNRPSTGYTFTESSPVLASHLIERFGATAALDGHAALADGTMVVALDVIEHIEHDHAALTELAERMPVGASIVVTVPALQCAFSSWDSELGHYRRYSRRTLRNAVQSAGLAVDETAYLFPELLPLLVVRKLRRGTRSDVDFPRLPAPVEWIGYRLATLTTRCRRWAPAGTSVLAVARKVH